MHVLHGGVEFRRGFSYAWVAMQSQYDKDDVRRVIDRLVERIGAAFAKDQPLNVVGVRTRGETLANRIVAALRDKGYGQIGQGVLDVALYRDDFNEGGRKPMVRPTVLNIDLDNKPLLLVDDVIFTGRSVRAAINALSDFGRPRMIRLAVLVDRGGRELPIHADFVGLTLKDVPADHRVNVHFVENDGVDEIIVAPRAS
jgi:pyrimidine operon attenuation protein / uracil phosphoribosyltransferase